MFGLLNSASAISAAFFMDSAATPALPCADNGSTRPTRTWPSPTGAVVSCSPGSGAIGAPPPNWVVQAARTSPFAATDRTVRYSRHTHINFPSSRDLPDIVAPYPTGHVQL